MAYWDWDPSYEVGITEIDTQHKRIIQYINELQAVIRTKDREKIAEVINGVAEYTVTHFAYEEMLMRECDYAEFDAHKKIHDDFIALVTRYSNDFAEGRDVAGQLMAELQIWLIHHIVNTDKRYVGPIKEMREHRAHAKHKEIKKQKGLFAKLFGK
jgi:hemerythrin